MGMGRNKPVVIVVIKRGEHVILQVNGVEVADEECAYTTNQLGVFAGINTLAMLKKVSIEYLR
jgi:hypothetical protein